MGRFDCVTVAYQIMHVQEFIRIFIALFIKVNIRSERLT